MEDASNGRFDISSTTLHVLAMAFMLTDHMWATVMGGHDWMTGVGRLAFPIFAFMAVEGYFHTRSFKRYMLRMLIFALISEIPFNLMYNGSVLFPFHQNVLWTFLLGLLCIRAIEWVKARGKLYLTIPAAALVAFFGWLVGSVTMVDYYGAGVLTVLCFYFFRERKWWCLLGQIAVLYWINVVLLKGMYIPVTIFGMSLELHRQGLALLALIPIWLYRGRKGKSCRAFQYFCYAFYPAHMLILALTAMNM